MLAPVVTECVAFGVYTCLVAVTIAVIFRCQAAAPAVRGHSKKLLLVAICVVMYSIATTHLGISLYTIFEDDRRSRMIRQIALTCEASDPSTPCAPIPHELQLATRGRFGQGMSVLLSANVALSDVIVLWRALVLWSRHRAILAFSAVLMLGTVVLFVWNAAIYYRPGHVDAHVSTVAFLASWLTNLWATALVACKTWHYRRAVVAHLRAPLRTRAERALLLFIESGVLYCLFWVPLIAASILVSADWGAASHLRALARAGQAVHFSGAQRLLQAMDTLATGALVDIVGIYPTAVVLLVELSGRAAERVLSARDMPTLESHAGVAQIPAMQERPVLHLHIQDISLNMEDGEMDDVEKDRPRFAL